MYVDPITGTTHTGPTTSPENSYTFEIEGESKKKSHRFFFSFFSILFFFLVSTLYYIYFNLILCYWCFFNYFIIFLFGIFTFIGGRHHIYFNFILSYPILLCTTQYYLISWYIIVKYIFSHTFTLYYIKLLYPILGYTLLYYCIKLFCIIIFHLTKTFLSVYLGDVKDIIVQMRSSIKNLNHEINLEIKNMQKNTKNILPDGREAPNQKLRELRDKLTAAQSVLSSNQQEKKTTFLAFSPAIDVSVLRQVSYIRSIDYVFGLFMSLLVWVD